MTYSIEQLIRLGEAWEEYTETCLLASEHMDDTFAKIGEMALAANREFEQACRAARNKYMSVRSEVIAKEKRATRK